MITSALLIHLHHHPDFLPQRHGKKLNEKQLELELKSSGKKSGRPPNPAHLIAWERQDWSPEKASFLLVVTRRGWEPAWNRA